jgi:hypothetical protein
MPNDMNTNRIRHGRTIGIFLVISWLTAGCEPVRHYNRLQVASFAGPIKPIRKPYGTVQVFPTPTDVKRQYEVIGMLSCEGSAGEEAAIVNAMLYRAADMGGDGILLNTAKAGAEDLSGQRIDVRLGWAALAGGGNSRAYRAQVVRFKD